MSKNFRKPRVAIHSITGCAGCQLVIYFVRNKLLELLDKIDLVAAPMIKERNDEGPYDVCFVEGLVANQNDLENLKNWREQSKYLIAWGTCATHGNVPGIKNFKDKEVVESAVYKDKSNLVGGSSTLVPSAISEHVKVDFEVSGCPPSEIEFLRLMQHLLMNVEPKIYNEPVCVECTKREIRCLLDDGKECLGPIIRGGCNALCPAVNYGCTGCHGPLKSANFEQMIKLLEECGVSRELINQRLQKYAGSKFEELGVDIR
ncbi:MAG: hypothetical protein KKF89_01285 [Nanoarchaeota archaeon]|nr:hypothetical protein [Nanoarchaeota archaeon]MBU1854329.1 hypothetical protein [Nanoarchaeota archaeon]